MKKNVKIFTLLSVIFIAVSCEQKETIYNGTAQLGFSTNKMTVRALPAKTEYSVNYGLTNKAAVAVKCDFSVVKNTNPAGDRFHILTDLSNVTIPQGDVFGTLTFYASNPAYDGGLRDTLILAIKSNQASVSYYDTLTVYFQQLCPVHNVADLEGYYQYYDADGFDPGLEYKVTYVADDTLLFTMTTPVAYVFGVVASNPTPFKIIVNSSEDGYTTTVIDFQQIYTDSRYGRVMARTNSFDNVPLAGEIDFCQEYLEIAFGRSLPDQGATAWFGGYVGFPLKRARLLQ